MIAYFAKIVNYFNANDANLREQTRTIYNGLRKIRACSRRSRLSDILINTYDQS